MSAPGTRRTAALIGLAAYALLAVVVLVSPLSPGAIVEAVDRVVRGALGAVGFGSGGFGTGWIEFALNIVLFLPVGALLTLWLGRPWRALAIAVVVSASAELVQVLLPARMPSLRDVLANAAGAGAGVLIVWLLIRPSRRRRGTTRAR
ncbi:VanZ family protein [Microbacterium oleivorans]|uniref:VanZ family protein n=1 Tax=Microbacterium oleivorans TaxID=273677 RepID=UPI00080DE126|nr:VanZ family protein [Microbacterium oleivorans]